MDLVEKVSKDMVAAMKSREADRLSTLRMMKAALKNKEIEKRGTLTDSEAQQVLATMVKQRHDSIEQFRKGNRPELAEKEASEIPIIEAYMPQAATESVIQETITAAVAEISASGQPLTVKDMGRVMKAVQGKLQAADLRADGKQVSEMVKAALAGS